MDELTSHFIVHRAHSQTSSPQSLITPFWAQQTVKQPGEVEWPAIFTSSRFRVSFKICWLPDIYSFHGTMPWVWSQPAFSPQTSQWPQQCFMAKQSITKRWTAEPCQHSLRTYHVYKGKSLSPMLRDRYSDSKHFSWFFKIYTRWQHDMLEKAWALSQQNQGSCLDKSMFRSKPLTTNNSKLSFFQ